MKINPDGTLIEAIEEITWQNSKGKEAYFKGKGNGEVIIEVEDGIKKN